MFKIDYRTSNDFKNNFEKHRLHISTMNIFYNNIRLLNNHHKYLDRKTYKEYCHDLLKDIELVTSPLDAIVPCDDETSKNIFKMNQLVPEYEKIFSIMTIDKLYEILPPTNDVHIKLKDNKNILTDVIDDIFIYFCVYKYLEQIDFIRLNTFNNMRPIIEYVVNNITEKDIKNFIVSKKVNEEKYSRYCSDIIFNIDFARTQKFYAEEIKKENINSDIPPIDVLSLMIKLATNIVVKSDIYIIIGIYLILSSSISDIFNNNIDNSPCAKYVRDVLSKI